MMYLTKAAFDTKYEVLDQFITSVFPVSFYRKSWDAGPEVYEGLSKSS